MPATSTYTAIGKVTLSSTVTTISFTNIPQTYTDLVLVQNAIITSGAYSTGIQFNGDIISTSTNYNSIGALQNSATNVNSSTNNNQPYTYDGLTGASRSIVVWQIMDYANNKTWKSVLCRGGFQSSQLRSTVSTWKNTQSINSINIVTEYAPSSPFLSTSTWTLYGIGAKQIKASGGDIIVSDGTYWYHAFRKSGTFTPVTALTCDVLTIAGGGGGGGGGGGAGGVLFSASQSISSAQTVTVGAGATNNGTGSNSVFGSLTASGGGASDGGNGGSGGGSSTSSAGGTGVAGQGNNGGSGAAPTFGGGGGAGAVGGNGNNSVAGAGGSGTSTYATWASTTGTGNYDGFYGGGGGGGSGVSNQTTAGAAGVGGGGRGAYYERGFAGEPNTGGGGGGSYGTNGGAGGSGIVIVRYPV